jgi:hypothetical protein
MTGARIAPTKRCVHVTTYVRTCFRLGVLMPACLPAWFVCCRFACVSHGIFRPALTLMLMLPSFPACPCAAAVINNMPHGGTLIVMPPTLIDQWCVAAAVVGERALWSGYCFCGLGQGLPRRCPYPFAGAVVCSATISRWQQLSCADVKDAVMCVLCAGRRRSARPQRRS